MGSDVRSVPPYSFHRFSTPFYNPTSFKLKQNRPSFDGNEKNQKYSRHIYWTFVHNILFEICSEETRLGSVVQVVKS